MITTDGYKLRGGPVEALRQALRQALDDKPPVKSYCGGKPNYCTPEQEPFAWMEDNEGNKYKIPEVNKGPLLKAMELAWNEAPLCKTHPDAPHGFDRNASHSADRYVCECESWEPVDAVNMTQDRVDEKAKDRLVRIMGTFDLATGHADTLDQALDALEEELRDVLGHLRARQQQEPFIYIREDTEMPFGGYEHCGQYDAGAFPVYLAPPKRDSSSWVGLTDADIAQTMHGSVEGSNMLPYQFARAIEAKLKEKNVPQP